ncbi:Hpt domain-containing protein [Marinomonas sp. 15G1-11]|uniref:Hpt domain-containing protein n=1 Tax=Marinomonas phaeophyticola TaxID=3004091 RepID=A0ABT4JWL3_9GAMM|nr:Hpt domain-containing protein [Marinomonas sp. 15G1-11]MCZ2722606.1 Hpt domain-containing protein [Marinomonas sp. 15G1-11]
MEEHENVIFDKESFYRRMGHNAQLISIVSKEFIKEASSQVEELKAIAATGNRLELSRQAHKLKGSSAEVAGNRMQRISFSLEKAAKLDESVVSQAVLLEKVILLEKEFLDLKKELELSA